MEGAEETEDAADAADAEEVAEEAVAAGLAAAAAAAVRQDAQAGAGVAASADAAAAPAAVLSPERAFEPQHPSTCEHGVPFGVCGRCRAGGIADSDSTDGVPPARGRTLDDRW